MSSLMIRINPSSAAFAVGDMVISEAKQGCLRYLLLKTHMPKPDPIDPKFAVMGELGEVNYMEYLINEQECPFHRELKFRRELDDVQISGRMDFVTYHETFKVIHEHKTSQSKSFLYNVMKKGIPKVNHVAQLVFYLIHMDETRGKLVCLYDPTGERRIFKVQVLPDGGISIDGRKYIYSVRNQLDHQHLSAHVIKTGEIWTRPCGNACKWCLYKEECDKFDDATGGVGTIKEFMEVNNG